jgi:AGZA family xanthine/uracil permease-like MFS transporter
MEAASVPAPASGGLLDRYFRLTERRATVRGEVRGGVGTFLTMCYILFVNPAILSAAGVPFDAVTVATALAAAIATIAMGLIANMPFALASGLGLNAVVAFDIIIGRKVGWPTGMACVVIEGLVALVLVVAGLREAVVRAVPASLKLAIGVGIGLFIALVGLRQGGIVVNDPATGIALGDLTTGPALIALGGILVSAACAARDIRGSILIGILTSTVLGLAFGVLHGPSAVAQWPHAGDFSTIGDAWGHIGDALTWALVPTIFALFITDFFDTIGTAVAVGTAGGLVDDRGELPGMRRVLLVDSAAAALGGTMGVSSVTTYVESGAGVSEGARTGLASVVTGALFAAAIFFVPLIAMIGQTVPGADKTFISPAVAPALVMVGYLMIRLIPGIDWDRPETAIPSFLIIVGIPMTFSISAGIGLGVLSFVVVMTVRGRIREIHPLMWLLVPMFVAFFADDWLSAHVF